MPHYFIQTLISSFNPRAPELIYQQCIAGDLLENGPDKLYFIGKAVMTRVYRYD